MVKQCKHALSIMAGIGVNAFAVLTQAAAVIYGGRVGNHRDERGEPDGGVIDEDVVQAFGELERAAREQRFERALAACQDLADEVAAMAHVGEQRPIVREQPLRLGPERL